MRRRSTRAGGPRCRDSGRCSLTCRRADCTLRKLSRQSVSGRWITAAVELLDRLWSTQSEAIDEAAALCAEAIGSGGLVHLFGTGHSRIPVEEMFPRYGSYPGFHPIVELSTTFHTQVVGANGQRQAMFIERVEGLAEVILANFRLAPPDAMIVFSAGGHGANGIEMAAGARRRGLPVIAVTSLAQSNAVAAVALHGDPAVRPRRRRHRPRAPRRPTPSSASTGWRARSGRARRSPPSPSSTRSRCRLPPGSSSAARCLRC